MYYTDRQMRPSPKVKDVFPLPQEYHGREVVSCDIHIHVLTTTSLASSEAVFDFQKLMGLQYFGEFIPHGLPFK